MADKDKNKQKGGQTGGQTPAGSTPAAGQPPVTVPPAQTPAAPVAPAAQPPAKPLTAMEILGQRMTVLESRMLAVEEFITKGGVVGGKGAPKMKFGGKRGGVPTKDTVTGLMYESKSALGKALAAEHGLDPNDHFVWYGLIKKFPGRFVDCSEAEAAQVMAARDARVQAEIDEANKKLAEQEAANNLAAQKK